MLFVTKRMFRLKRLGSGLTCSQQQLLSSSSLSSSTSSSSSSSSTSVAATMTETFHRRKLPDSLIALSSPVGRRLFKESLEDDTMESYFPLAEQFITQSEPSYCSLSSLAMVLNALHHDPEKTWKGVWRWVTEETLQCESHDILCGHSLEKIKRDGMDFKDFQALGKCHKVTIESFMSPRIENVSTEDSAREQYENGLHTFRKIVISSCSKQPNAKTSESMPPPFFVICNFSRKVLDQTGDGHFSPVGGYHAATDSALVMDVARFKYPPFWVPVTTLWKSMAVEDVTTGSPRGYFIVRSSKT